MSCRSPRRSAPSTSTANCGRRRSGASGESPPSVATAERLPASTARPGPCRVAAMPLPQGLGRFNRLVTNPVTRTFAGRVPGFAIVVHRGRTSGRRYRTPVNAFARPDGGYTLALTYGPDAQWVRNVLAQGGCTLEATGRRGQRRAEYPRALERCSTGRRTRRPAPDARLEWTPSTTVKTPPTELAARLRELTLADQQRLRRRLDRARKLRGAEARQAAVAEIATEVDAAERRVARRRAAVPKVSYPAALPIAGKRDEILAAVRDHQVVIVAGETGSGKTTQLPKMCLELGRGVRGAIGHTQPRRLAARTVAERVAEELETPLGGAVGYKVRFSDHASDDTLVKVMTDGILLAELLDDRMLRRYDTLIIDEAHERSLNIDFILGYLAQLLPRRPDLKVIITSATIDPERFSRHFGDAPVIEVSGRTYPVEVRYRPIADDADSDQVQAISDAVDELRAAGRGDVLVFLSGEREIRDTADALRRADQRDTEILPLYARLSAAEQHRVFQPHPGRRIVLATNVAETSLTVPGIRYVIDPGTARISRYSHRTKVQRLPIEPISRASANQRKGRCGRTADGICIRLYSEEDFESRPEFTDPEILRTNLASVILQMATLGLGDVASFPFIDPPDHRNVRDGVQLLEELGAFDPSVKDAGKRLTPLGRKLA